MTRAGVLTTLLIVCLSVLTVDCSPPVSRHQLELKEHYDHLAYIAEFKCHTPQPRVVPMTELLNEKELHGKAFFPDVTVLHRCEAATGCCDNGFHCAPAHKVPVHLPFKVTYLDGIKGHKKGSWEIVYHYFDNHTDCGCVENHHEPSHHSEDEIHPTPIHPTGHEETSHHQEITPTHHHSGHEESSSSVHSEEPLPSTHHSAHKEPSSPTDHEAGSEHSSETHHSSGHGQSSSVEQYSGHSEEHSSSISSEKGSSSLQQSEEKEEPSLEPDEEQNVEGSDHHSEKRKAGSSESPVAEKENSTSTRPDEVCEPASNEEETSEKQ